MELGGKLGRTLAVVKFIFAEDLDEGLIVEVSDEVAIVRLVGVNALSITSKIVGLLLAALGVEYMFQGANEWVAMYWGTASALML